MESNILRLLILEMLQINLPIKILMVIQCIKQQQALRFGQMKVMLLLLISDMHTYVLRAVCDSFQLVPIGGSSFQWDSLLLTMTKFITDTFVIGFRIFLPFFACIMILNCILGIMAKVSPQMNMFSVGMQLKVLTGLVVMLLTIFLLPRISEYIFDEIKFIVRAIIEGMHT